MSHDLLPVAILAGGLGQRLGPLTADVPKALMNVNGEPFIAHQLRLLHANGARRVVVCVGFLGQAIQEVVGDGSEWGVEAVFASDGARLRGEPCCLCTPAASLLPTVPRSAPGEEDDHGIDIAEQDVDDDEQKRRAAEMPEARVLANGVEVAILAEVAKVAVAQLNGAAK